VSISVSSSAAAEARVFFFGDVPLFSSLFSFAFSSGEESEGDSGVSLWIQEFKMKNPQCDFHYAVSARN